MTILFSNVFSPIKTAPAAASIIAGYFQINRRSCRKIDDKMRTNIGFMYQIETTLDTSSNESAL